MGWLASGGWGGGGGNGAGFVMAVGGPSDGGGDGGGGGAGTSPRGGGSSASPVEGKFCASAGRTMASIAASTVPISSFRATAAMPFLPSTIRTFTCAGTKTQFHNLPARAGQAQSDDAIERPTRHAQRLDAPRDRRVFLQ